MIRLGRLKLIEKDWEMLLTIYEEKNISKAAQRLFVSQPALSYRIKAIEKQLNIKVFIKGKKNISFTKEGELLVSYARKMKIENQKLIDQLKGAKSKYSGELRIGVSSNFADLSLIHI